MAQSFEINYTSKGYYTLYDRNDFEKCRDLAIDSIDHMMAYLTEAREKIVAIAPGSNEVNPMTIANGLYNEYDVEGYPETSGCCVDVLHDLWALTRIVDNLYCQERYAGKIEENWTHFR